VKALTVSELTAGIKNKLEVAFPGVWVVGEVAKANLHRSGHFYLDLKDGNAVIGAVMWRTEVQRQTALPEVGTEIFVFGRLTVYAPQGNYQLQIGQWHPKGLGAQDLALRRLKERLQKLGYFAAERKRPLPRFPRRIVLMASPSGAAIRDMLEVLRQRWPAAEVWVLSVGVQGPGAPDSIADRFTLLNRCNGVDVVILGRGGGSSDDLSAFNDERVARAIFRCKFPVVTAIGHEIDFTIADLVADHRAITPTDAANQVSPDRRKLLADLDVRALQLHDRVQSTLLAVKNRLLEIAKRRAFCVPLERLHDRERALDDWSDRLLRAMQKRTAHAQKQIEVVAAKLESLSPLNVLARGYSLTRTLPDHHVVRAIAQVQTDDVVEIVVNDGRLLARIEQREAKAAD
jgi:exodeoxyribonuclease VII large subunit